MAQVALYLDAETAQMVEEAANRDGVSRSGWIRQAVRAQLARRLPDSFFAVLGTWEDEREPEEILKSIRLGMPDQVREPLN